MLKILSKKFSELTKEPKLANMNALVDLILLPKNENFIPVARPILTEMVARLNPQTASNLSVDVTKVLSYIFEVDCRTNSQDTRLQMSTKRQFVFELLRIIPLFGSETDLKQVALIANRQGVAETNDQIYEAAVACLPLLQNRVANGLLLRAARGNDLELLRVAEFVPEPDTSVLLRAIDGKERNHES